ncbi:hypothetical protein [Cyanophage S-TIM54]|nr:hypothetical protein [Cyanophage S-TIM54]
MFDYVEFINEGYTSQQKYATAAGQPGPFDYMTQKERYAKVIEYLSHLIEETIEARVYVPRRSWKNNEPSYLDNKELREEFVAEMFDILLFHRAALAYAGIDGKEFADIAAKKLNYNSKRKDHNINGDESASQNPAEELQGNCASADFNKDEGN